ncbi:Helix-turn-helix domain-containing protein, partial [Dysosmobacter welbionis]
GDKGPQVRRGGGEQRVGGGQNGHQYRQQRQGAGRPQQQGQDPPGGAVLFLRPGGGQCCPQMAEEAPQQQTEPLPQHGGTPPGQKLSAGEADGVDGQQGQQGQQIPRPEIPVGPQGQRGGQGQIHRQQNAALPGVQQGAAQIEPQQAVPDADGGGQSRGGAAPKQRVHQQKTEAEGQRQKQSLSGGDHINFHRILRRLRRPSRRQGFFMFIHNGFSFFGAVSTAGTVNA